MVNDGSSLTSDLSSSFDNNIWTKSSNLLTFVLKISTSLSKIWQRSFIVKTGWTMGLAIGISLNLVGCSSLSSLNNVAIDATESSSDWRGCLVDKDTISWKSRSRLVNKILSVFLKILD